jgi:hypothetical protein
LGKIEFPPSDYNQEAEEIKDDHVKDGEQFFTLKAEQAFRKA